MALDQAAWGSTQFFLEVSKGNIPQHSLVIIRGHTPDVDIANSPADVWENGDRLVYLTEAKAHTIVSTSEDDKSPAGDGARTILVEGLDGNYDPLVETVALDGTTPVALVNNYLRILNISVETSAVDASNVGRITVIDADTNDQCIMDADEGLSMNSHFTVPRNFLLFIQQCEFNTVRTAGLVEPMVEFEVLAREGPNKPWLQVLDKKIDAARQSELQVTVPFVAGECPETCDLRIRVSTDKNNTDCRTRMYGTLVYQNPASGIQLPEDFAAKFF